MFRASIHDHELARPHFKQRRCRGEGKDRDEALIRTLAYLSDSVDHIRCVSGPCNHRAGKVLVTTMLMVTRLALTRLSAHWRALTISQ